MALLPVSTTRTNNALSTQRLLQQLNADQMAIQKQYDQLSTGRRVLRLSDDPAAANRAIALNRGIDRGEQLVRNAHSVTGSYDSADSALGKISSALVEARGAAVEGAQTVLSYDERVAISTTISETIQNLFAAGNSMFRDQQLLGGILDSGNALVHDGHEIVYTGRSAIGRTEIGTGAPAAINVTASESLGAYSLILEGKRFAGVRLDLRFSALAVLRSFCIRFATSRIPLASLSPVAPNWLNRLDETIRILRTVLPR